MSIQGFARSFSLPHRAGTLGISLGILVTMVVCSALFLNGFLGAGNLSNLFSQSTTLTICALGQTFVLITGGLDVSLGSIVSLTTSIMTLDELPEVVRLLVAFAAAGVFGFINGFGVARLNVHPIIMTLSTMGVVQGISYFVLAIPGGIVPSWLSWSVAASWGPLPSALFWLIAVVAIAGWILYRTPFGLHLFAVGGNASNARMNGVRVERTIITAYMLSATFACVAGLFLAGRLASGDPKGGASFGIDSVMAAALGGVNLSGGIGSVIGAVTGAAILGMVGNTMNLLNVSAFLQNVVKGLLLLLLVVSQRRKDIGL